MGASREVHAYLDIEKGSYVHFCGIRYPDSVIGMDLRYFKVVRWPERPADGRTT
jgi:hypothetical protein